MIDTELAIVGGGPAGLSAALTASRLGAHPLLIDDNPLLGGQLIKQTHKFFGSRDLYCGIRGMDIAKILQNELPTDRVKLLLNASVVGFYPGNILGVSFADRLVKVKAQRIILATGASENSIAFPGSDLPGVYGAGAVQTLMNVACVRPGRRVLMIGAGNVGLIVSYQLRQAGIEVACVIDILPRISGYHVHAAKLARLGVPILTRHTILRVLGHKSVAGAVIARVDRKLCPIAATCRRLKVDTVCLAVGLTPLSELLRQAGCRMTYISELGGNVAWHDEKMETSVPGVYVAGDLSGIEEASTAILEGRLAGAAAAQALCGESEEAQKLMAKTQRQLKEIRTGPFGEKAVQGKQQLRLLSAAVGNTQGS